MANRKPWVLANGQWQLLQSGDLVDGSITGNAATVTNGLYTTGGTLSGRMLVNGDGNIVYENDNGVYIPRPQNATYRTTTASVTGALAVQLPTSLFNGASDMISFWVDIYDYATNESVSLYVFGYIYNSAGQWVNCGATLLTSNASKDFTVRFCHDGTRPIVCIGEVGSTWDYPQVTVRDFQAGFTAAANNSDDGWAITFLTVLPTVMQTATSNLPVAKSATTATDATNIIGGNQTGDYQVTSGKFTRWGHANQNDSNDGKIGANLFGSGLNIIGTQTTAGVGRQIRLWGTLLDSNSVEYVRNTGSWGISVTGNAATATTATNQSGGTVSATTGAFSGLVQVTNNTTIDTTTPGLANYGLHFTGQVTADYAAGITWNGGTGSTGAQAGVYVQGSGFYGTKMYFATTDSYATGAKTALSISHTGVANFTRQRPTALGNTILDTANVGSYAPTLTGTGASGTWGISVTGNAATVTSITSGQVTTALGYTPYNSTNPSGYQTAANVSAFFGSPGTSGTLDWNDVSNTKPGATGTLLLGSATNGMGGGNYYHPFNLEYATKDGSGNVTQMAVAYGSPGNELWMRGRYNGSWSSWTKYINSSNYTDYTVTKTGTGASGTWGINITGNAATVTNGMTTAASSNSSAGVVHTAVVNSNNAIASLPSSLTGWNAEGNGTGPAVMTFHRPGAYAGFFGLDTDNKWKVGGWSMGAVSYEILHQGSYNTYAPTLTGTGASGTWGISVTGNAATVTNGVYTTGNQTVAGEKTFSSNLYSQGVLYAKSGGTGEAIRVGDDSALHDVNVANTLGVKGLQNANNGYIQFGADTNQLGYGGSGLTYGGVELGFRDIPQNLQNAAYTFALSDRGKSIGKDAATAYTYTIPANSSVAFPVGTAITVFNNNATANVTIAITTDTLRLGGTTTTGSRTLAPFGVCTLLKVASTVWIASGAGLT